VSARPLVGVSWMPHPGFREAVGPLLAAGRLEAVEWTVDMGFGLPVPASAAAVLDAFGRAGRLWAHGVGYSPLGAGRGDVAEAWLDEVRADVGRHRYRGLSEHFGFCAGGPIRSGAPLPVPRTAATLAAGRSRLARLAEAAGVPIGLENLALTFSASEALEHGAFLAELVHGVDGYLHLDLHNLWCQAVNFDLDPEVLLAGYPAERVRVVHVSGGSTVDGIRRDTHDDAVPEEVWGLLQAALPRLPRVEAVFLERIGPSFGAEGAPAQFLADWERLRAVREEAFREGAPPKASREGAPPKASREGAPPEASREGAPPEALPGVPAERGARLGPAPADGSDWAALQRSLLSGLAAGGAESVSALLADGGLDGPARSWLERAEPRMLEVAGRLVRRWWRRDS
jgi:uncharacterized protein